VEVLAALAAFPALRRLDVDEAPARSGWSALAAELGPVGIEVRVDGRIVAPDRR
jgi:hypothetical protein